MMTEKEHSMFLKHEISLNSQSTKFFKFNLNQRYKCFDNESTLVQTFSKSINDKNFGYTVIEKNNHEKDKSWNNFDKGLWLKTSKISNVGFKEEYQNQKFLINDKGISNPRNISTLSLHISAYENSIEDDSDECKDLLKTPRTLKVEEALSKLEDSFEFPRQMKDAKSPTPEIQQFAASQKLLSPNQGSMGRGNPKPKNKPQLGINQNPKPNEISLRISFLQQAAKLMAEKSESKNDTPALLSKLYMEELNEVRNMQQTLLSKDLRRSFCRHCNRIWIPNQNGENGLEVKIKKDRIYRTCTDCDSTASFVRNPKYRSRNEKN